jgi:hypothetical protein
VIEASPDDVAHAILLAASEFRDFVGGSTVLADVGRSGEGLGVGHPKDTRRRSGWKGEDLPRAVSPPEGTGGGPGIDRAW